MIEDIRAKLTDMGMASWSSPQWQDAILDHIKEKAGEFDSIIEVGCAYGGLSAQLAYVASQNNLSLVLIDISEKMNEAKNKVLEHFSFFGIKDKILLFDSSFMNFAKERTDFHGRAIVIIDASHYFENTIKDIGAMYYLRNLPISVFLHDYSLRRYPDPMGLSYITAVDHAIQYCYGDAQPVFIGTQYNSKNEGWDHPYESTNAYYVHGGWEGCMFSPLPKPLFVFGKEFNEYKLIVDGM